VQIIISVAFSSLFNAYIWRNVISFVLYLTNNKCMLCSHITLHLFVFKNHFFNYRKLSVLRENFNSTKLKFLKHDIPVMALTATATIPVREDIVKSLKMSEDTKIVLTSFFRPNLQLV
jgi:hypothetical protein